MNLIYIFGPSAVGKQTISVKLSKSINYPTIDQHKIMDLGKGFITKNTVANHMFNLKIKLATLTYLMEFSEDRDGIIFSDVLLLDNKNTFYYLARLLKAVNKFNYNVYFVELYASQDIRLRRNNSKPRVTKKNSKKNVNKSRQMLLESDERHRLNVENDNHFFFSHPSINHLRINNESKDINQTIEVIKSFVLKHS